MQNEKIILYIIFYKSYLIIASLFLISDGTLAALFLSFQILSNKKATLDFRVANTSYIIDWIIFLN